MRQMSFGGRAPPHPVGEGELTCPPYLLTVAGEEVGREKKG